MQRKISWLVGIVAAFALALPAGLVAAPEGAQAAVYPSCTVAGCDDARSANSIWQSKGYPGQRGWNDWPDGLSNFAGGTHQNREGQLPRNGSYLEFDVYSRTRGARRDAYRIVVDRNSGATYYSPNHYKDFYKL